MVLNFSVQTEKFKLCRRNITGFFMDLLSTVLFSDDSERIPEDVLEKLLNYISGDRRAASSSAYQNLGALDSGKNTMVFVLQMMLRYK